MYNHQLDAFVQVAELKSFTKTVHRDIHNDLVTLPLETYLTIPHGLTYASTPTNATSKFIKIVKDLSKQKAFFLR